MNTALIEDDMDLLILFCYYASLGSHNHNVLFLPIPKKIQRSKSGTKEQLGPDICCNILFMHAVLGCDATSQLYGIGKGTCIHQEILNIFESKLKYLLKSQLP